VRPPSALPLPAGVPLVRASRLLCLRSGCFPLSQVDPALCGVHAVAVAGKHRGPDWPRLCQATQRTYDLFDSGRLTIEELNTLEAAAACGDCWDWREEFLHYRAALDPPKPPRG
jgi:hypothetical protein